MDWLPPPWPPQRPCLDADRSPIFLPTPILPCLLFLSGTFTCDSFRPWSSLRYARAAQKHPLDVPPVPFSSPLPFSLNLKQHPGAARCCVRALNKENLVFGNKRVFATQSRITHDYINTPGTGKGHLARAVAVARVALCLRSRALPILRRATPL